MATDLPKIILKKNDATQVEVSLHGATVISWKCKGSEVLFVSKQAVFDGKKAIRGGIPVVFPNFGPWSLGPQHGFARTQSWKVDKKPYQDENGNVVAVLLLEDTEELRKIWNYKFKVWYTLTLKDCEFRTELKIENTGEEAFEFTTLLHTYYRANSIENVKLQGLKGCNYIDKSKYFQPTPKRLQKTFEIILHANRNTALQIVVTKVMGGEHMESSEFVQISRNVDSVYKNTPQEHLLCAGDYKIKIQKENFPDTVVWNPWTEKAKQMTDFGDNEYTNMVCVEPGYVASPYKLLPKETFEAKQVLTCLC